MNEFERIRILSKHFVIYAFVLVSITNLHEARSHKKNWFENTQAAIIIFPYVNVYGARTLSILAAAMAVAMAVALLKSTRGVDAVVSRASLPSLPLALISKLAGIRFLYNAPYDPFSYKDMSTVIQNRYFVFIIKMADYVVLRNANYVCVATHSAAEDLRGFIEGEKIVILPFPVSESYFDHSSRVRRKEGVNLIYYGSVTDRYDFSPLIRGLQAMNKTVEASLTIYASQEGRDRLRSYASLPFIHLRDQVSVKQLREEICRATAVVVPWSERIGRILAIKSVQAMALGVPVIVSNPREAIFRDGETCFVVSANSSRGWQTAIQRATVPKWRARVIRGAREEAEAFRPERNAAVISSLLVMDENLSLELGADA